MVFRLTRLLDALYLQFLFTRVSFSLNDVVHLRLPMQTSSVYMRINGNFDTMFELVDGERCLIHNLRVDKHWRFRKNYENVIKQMSRFKLRIISSKCEVVQTV